MNSKKCFRLENIDVGFTFSVKDGIRKGRIFKRLEIPVSEEVYGGMTKAELSEAEKIELWLAQQDLKMERIKDKKNALESYVYEMRDKVYSFKNLEIPVKFPLPSANLLLSASKLACRIHAILAVQCICGMHYKINLPM